MKSGYLPSEIAYIKPATQCEEPQLILGFAKQKGLQIIIGPLVFYSGFTRAFLNGETDSTKDIESIEMAVDEIAKGKRFVVIDGVVTRLLAPFVAAQMPLLHTAVGHPSCSLEKEV